MPNLFKWKQEWTEKKSVEVTMKEYFFADASALQTWAKIWAHSFSPGAFLMLKGDLGAGKTTFVQGLALGLGIHEPVTSPTFALVQIYEQGRIPLVHADLYRISPEEVWSLGLHEEYAHALIAVEWCERLPFTPPNYVELAFAHNLENGRRVTVRFQSKDRVDHLPWATPPATLS